MANTKISELNAVTALAGTDVFPVVDVSASTTNKVSVTDLLRNAPAGTAGAPGIANADDQDTGILFPAANSIGVSTGGAQRLVIDSSGNCGINTTTPNYLLDVEKADAAIRVNALTGNSFAYLSCQDNTGIAGIYFGDAGSATTGRIQYRNNGDSLAFDTNGSERLRLDSSGRFLVGTSSARTINTTSSWRGVQIAGTTGFESLIIERYQGSGGPAILLGKSRGTSVGDYTIVQNNDGLGSLIFFGADGSDMNSQGARIDAFVDGTPGSNDMPGRLTFSTTADGASSPTERVRIDSSGNVGVGDSNPNFTLDVNGNVGIREDNNLTFHDGAGVAAFRIRGTSDNKLFFERASGNEHQMVIDDGNVGIGTATAGRTLSVDGSIQVSNSTSGFGLGEGFEILHEPGGATYLLNRENAETRFYTNNTERARIDASGRLLVGSSSTVGGGSVGELLQIGFSGGSRAILANTSTSLASGALLGQIDFTTNVGSSISTGATIKANCDGTAGSGDAPTRLSFFTSADGASSPTERVRINKDGHVKYYGNSSSAWLLSPASDVSSYSQLDAHFPASNRTLFFNEKTTNDSYVVWNRNSGSSGKGFGLEGQNFKVVQGSSEQLRVDSSGRLLIGSTSARANFYHSVVSPQVQQEGAGDFDRQAAIISSSSTNHFGAAFILAHQKSGSKGGNTALANGDVSGLLSFQANDGSHFLEHARIQAFVDGASGTDDMPGALQFFTAGDGAQTVTERMRITRDGNVTIGSNGTTTLYNQASVTGAVIERAGAIQLARSGDQSLLINRISNDGSLVSFYQDGTFEGSISVSGSTVSYNGAHLSRWSQLAGNAERTEILRGSVLSNLDEMCEWGEEDNEQLNRMKVSDVEGDVNVSGVFQTWDDDDDTYTNDFYCAMTGDFVIRIAQGTTVARGDLLMSAGDGTAKPQDDDIVRSKTIAKVTSTTVSTTYSDGSYCVPCVLMAC